MSLYDFQTADVVARLRTAVVQHRSVVYVLPIGGCGKTICAGEIARCAAAKSAKRRRAGRRGATCTVAAAAPWSTRSARYEFAW